MQGCVQFTGQGLGDVQSAVTAALAYVTSAGALRGPGLGFTFSAEGQRDVFSDTHAGAGFSDFLQHTRSR